MLPTPQRQKNQYIKVCIKSFFSQSVILDIEIVIIHIPHGQRQSNALKKVPFKDQEQLMMLAMVKGVFL